MVKKGQFIDFASNLNTEEMSTEMQIIIELAKKVKELENKITELDSEKEVVESG